MTNIKIYKLHRIGLELFHDKESFLDELKKKEMDKVLGGVASVVGTVYTYGNSTLTGIGTPMTIPKFLTNQFEELI